MLPIAAILLLPLALAQPAFRLVFEPPLGLLVREAENASFSFVFNGTGGESLVSARIVVLNPDIARVETQLIDLTSHSVGDGANHSVLMHGVFVGKSDVKIYIQTQNGNETEFTYYVGALRSKLSGTLTSAFVIIVTLMTFVNNALMGIQLDRQSIWEIIKKPVAPMIGFACQWLCMAPLATGWAFLLLSDAAQQFSLFLVGCCPGGGQSNKFTLLLDGNLDLSITLTFFSSIIALGMMPAWVYSLGTVFSSRLGLGGRSIQIPFDKIITSLVLAVAPAFIGLGIRHFRPQWQAKTLTIVKWTSFLVLIVIIPFAVSINLYIFSYFTWRTVLAGMALPASGFALGLSSGYIARQGYATSMALAVETSVQNVQIAMFVLRFALPEPDRDLVLVVPVCFIIFSAIPIWLLMLGRTILKCVRRRRGEEDDDAKAPREEEDPSPLNIIIAKLVAICAKEKDNKKDVTNVTLSNLEKTKAAKSVNDTTKARVGANGVDNMALQKD